MLFKRKNSKIEHNVSISNLQIPSINRSQLTFNDFLLKKIFVWNNKQINIIRAENVQKAEHYIGIHTEQGVFYIHSGMSWLQKMTSIYIEHEDEDTQNWLLERALENLPENSFPLEITGLSFHHYININKYSALYLNGYSNRPIFAFNDAWVKLFKKYRFIRKHTFSIDNLEIRKNILLGSQKLHYTDYKKLVCGNIILINENNFNLEGVTNIDIGSFNMVAAYHDNTLIFQSWNSNMNDKPYKDDQQDDEEWDQNESSLSNEYSEFDYNFNELNKFTSEQKNEEEPEHNYEENQEPLLEDQEQENIQEIEEDQPHPFANVPINLSFSLGTVKMAISNIMQLQEGSVIELHKSTPAQVSIYANGKIIGTGDIIEIDGKLGVQINKLEN